MTIIELERTDCGRYVTRDERFWVNRDVDERGISRRWVIHDDTGEFSLRLRGAAQWC